MYISRLLDKLYSIGIGLFNIMNDVVEMFFFTTIGAFVKNNPNIDNAITLIPNFVLDLTLFEMCLGILLPLYIVASIVKFFIGIIT